MDVEGMVTVEDVRAAATVIGPYVRRTPLLPYAAGIWLKAESLQLGGSFKLRGATYAVSLLSSDQRARGVITHSSGNHAQALARAGRTFGVAVTVVMPHSTPEVKVAATKGQGAQVVLVEPADRESTVEQIAADTGAVVIPPFDDGPVIAGQGTVGLEVVADLPDVSSVYVPVSGGGLVSGVAVAVKALAPHARVVAVEPALAGDLADGWARDERVAWPAAVTARTIADGLRVRGVGVLNWRHIRALVDDVVTVTEDEIADAVRRVVLDAKLVCEPSGAVALAGLLTSQELEPGPAVAIVSGGNVDPALLAALLSGQPG